MEKLLRLIKKLIPKPVFLFFQPAYHFLLAVTGNVLYRFPGYKLIVIGVTGTNGKSTTCDLITRVLKESNELVGMISTVSIEIAGERYDNVTNRTTLGRWKTHKLMRQMVRRGCKYAVIEVASEGIAWYRIFGIPFDAAVYTNLSPEHLNFHKTMKNYRNTKGKLFAKLDSPFNFKKTKRVSIVNADDKEAPYFSGFKADEKMTYGIKNGSLRAKRIEHLSSCINYQIENAGHTTNVTTKAIGEFNIYNELAAFCVGLAYGIKPEIMAKAFKNFAGTKGRVEKIEEGQKFQVIVDYAHTPDAQEKVYTELRRFSKGRIISVFGATGDKDRGKRPEMGRVAAHLTDIAIITDDETYGEKSEKIIQEIYAGVPEKLQKKVKVVPDRFAAIKEALLIARPEDIVIITGIGHQKYRIMNSKRTGWNERKIVSDLLKNLKKRKVK